MDFFPITQQSGQTPRPGVTRTEPIETDTTTTDETSSDPAEDFDTFLTLLTAQIRNQDPLEPVDSTQFVEQLATFSNLELQAKSNQILEGIAELIEGYLGTPSYNQPVAPADPEKLIM